jgi:hypothetical protein
MFMFIGSYVCMCSATHESDEHEPELPYSEQATHLLSGDDYEDLQAQYDDFASFSRDQRDLLSYANSFKQQRVLRPSQPMP